MMKRITLLAAVLTLPSLAHAQMATFDAGNYAINQLGLNNQVKDIAQGLQQLNALRQQVQEVQNMAYAAAHITDLGSAVSALGMVGIRNPLPISPYAVQSLMSGTGGISGMSSTLGGLFAGSASASHVYTAQPTTWLGQELARVGSGIAGGKALSLELYRAAGERMAHLDNLRGQISTASDPSTRESLIAQIGAENTAIANQQVQAQVITAYMQQEQQAEGQRHAERRQQEVEEVLNDARSHGINIARPAP